METIRERRDLLATGAAIATVLLSGFLLAQALGVSVLEDPRPTLADGGAPEAALGVALLVADAVLPVPSSLVMISLGALFGAIVGSALALAGRFGMAVAGFAIGRAGAPVLVKLIGSRRREHARRLVEHHGALAIIVSRPVPLLAETVILTAGATGMRWRLALAAAFVGSIPEAIAYGMVGAAAASFANGAFVWLAFLVAGTLFRLLELAHRRRRRSSTARPVSTSTSGA